MPRPDDVVEIAAAALEGYETQALTEQAVEGLDALDEVAIHPLLAAGFALAGLGACREQRYPSDRQRKSSAPVIDETTGELLAKETERQRCDLALTPAPGITIADPVIATRKALERKQQVAGTLFESIAAAAAPSPPPPNTIPPQDAFWLEVKLVGQYCYEAGIPGPNRTYASQLVRGSTLDLAKLSKDPLITTGGLLLILFTADHAVAEHDLVVLMHRCLDKGLIDTTPLTRRFPVQDRIGNTVCTVSLIRPLK